MKKVHERTGDETDSSSKLIYLLIGGVIGAAIALLLAPKSGDELRGNFAAATRKGIEKGKAAQAWISEKVDEYSQPEPESYEVAEEDSTASAERKAKQEEVSAELEGERDVNFEF